MPVGRVLAAFTVPVAAGFPSEKSPLSPSTIISDVYARHVKINWTFTIVQ